MIPIFNVVLISDKDKNAINNGKHVVLFLLSKYSDKLYGNIVYRTQIEMSNFIQVPVSHAKTLRKSNVILRLYFGNWRKLLSANVDVT